MLIDIVTHDASWPGRGKIEKTVGRALRHTIAKAALPADDRNEVSVVLSCDEDVRKLNARYRGIDAATNVLSFAQFDDLEPGHDNPLPPGPLGDIVLARETLLREADQAGIPFLDHLSHLVVHGLLHLFGYDHVKDEDALIMEQLEIDILAELGIPDPYGAQPGSDYGSVA